MQQRLERVPSSALTLVGGGVRSGKSRFALERACAVQGERRRFIATAQAHDDEMRSRIAAHRRERGERFETLEAPRDLVAALGRCHDADVVVVDCLTLWLSNLLLDHERAERVLPHVDALVETLDAMPCRCIVVSNEVGMGVVPESRLGREFRDLTGHAHQRVAACCDELFWAAMGTVLRLRPAPVEVVAP